MPSVPDNVVYVAVGSTNPVKIGATRTVLERLRPHIRIEGVRVASGVPDQPWGDEQTIAGARARGAGLGQVTSGLAHDPDRGFVDRLAFQRAQETVIEQRSLRHEFS